MSATERALREALRQRITDYLSLGGLFNPEMAYGGCVRDLLIECRDALAEPSAPSLVPKDTQGDEAQVSNEGKA